MIDYKSLVLSTLMRFDLDVALPSGMFYRLEDHLNSLIAAAMSVAWEEGRCVGTEACLRMIEKKEVVVDVNPYAKVKDDNKA